MKEFPSFDKPAIVNALICFYDMVNFTSAAKKINDPVKLFNFLQKIAEIIDTIISSTKGHIVKYIGDAGLIIYPDELVDEGVNALITLQKELHQFTADQDLNLKVTFAVHYGEIVIGKYKPFNTMDIGGDAVNIAARLEHACGNKFKGRFVISPQVFRKLKPGTRKLVHKFTPPVVYILE